MQLKHSVLTFFLVLAFSRINAENVNDKTGPWDPYTIHGVAHHRHKIPRPIPPSSYISKWQPPIEVSTKQYENDDVSQNVALMEVSTADIATTEDLISLDPTPAPVYAPMGPSLRPTLPPGPILRPTSSNTGSVPIQTLREQRPYQDNRVFARPTFPARPIFFPTTTAPVQVPTSEIPSISFQRGGPILPRRPVPRPIPQPTLIDTITTANPSIQPISEPILSTENMKPIASDTVLTSEIPSNSFQPGRPILPRWPVPRPLPQPPLIDTITTANPTTQPINEPFLSTEIMDPIASDTVVTSEIPSNSFQPGRPMFARPVLPKRPVPRPIPQPTLIDTITTPNPTIQPISEPIPSTVIMEPTASDTVVIPSQTERSIYSRPKLQLRPVPRPVPQPTLVNTTPPGKSTPSEPVPETMTSNPEFLKSTIQEIVQPNIPSSQPIQSGKPILNLRPIPTPLPQPTLIDKNTPTNPTIIEPESSDPAPKVESAPGSDLSLLFVTESPDISQKSILPSTQILQPTPIAPQQTASTSEPFGTTIPPPPGTEPPNIHTKTTLNEIEIITTQLPESAPQPLTNPLPESDEKPFLPSVRPSYNSVVEPRPTPVPSVRPEHITTRPNLPSRPIVSLPSYHPPAKSPIFPSRPLPEVIKNPNTVNNQPSYEIVAQRPLLTPAPTTPVQQPVLLYVSTPIDIEILNDYRCPQVDGYFSIANECDTYVECKTAVAVKYSCPDGLHFNPNAKWPEYACAYPSEVKCNSNAIQHQPRPTALCPRQYGYFPSRDGNCSSFILCQEGMATIMNCPSGLAFNPDKNSCDWPVNVPTCSPSVFQGFTCPVPPAADNELPSDTIYKFRFKNRCREYIACQHGHPRLLSCDPGLHFDEASQSCISSDYLTRCEL